MINKIRTIYNPPVFQGNLKKKKYFEGWYFKLISSQGMKLAIIPGIALSGKNSQDNHAFIQIIDGSTTETHYISFDLDQFTSINGLFQIQIGNCSFSHEEIHLDIDRGDTRITGNVKMQDRQPIPVSFLSPGIMGWYSFVPFMECYHGILSMNHRLTGNIKINQKIYNFNEGKGYAEKDWGRSFPKAWTWIQSNHFTGNEQTSIMLSIADIPWLGNFFIGFLCIIWISGVFYKFTTYTGSKITTFNYENNRLHVIVENKKYMLELSTNQNRSGILRAPEIGKMNRVIKEGLDAEIKVILLDKKQNKVLLEDTGKHAGFEMVGDINHLIDNIH
jgi:hypothetical protein